MGESSRGVFVTGTGTEVGKTVVAAAIAHTLAAAGRKVAVFKPAVTGLDEPGEPDHELLRRAAGSEQTDEQIAPYRYGPPASPHLAAAMVGEEIQPRQLLEAARAAADGAELLVCEGVGGLIVPLHVAENPSLRRVPLSIREEPATPSSYLVRDLAVDLALPLVISASPGLGTINHTLLTIEAARAVGLDVAGVVLTPWPEQPSEVEQSNRATIASLGEVEVLTLPRLDLSNPAGWPALAGPFR
jgi:dethiobiotin synthetase